jgi:hypothetical protein
MLIFSGVHVGVTKISAVFSVSELFYNKTIYCFELELFCSYAILFYLDWFTFCVAYTITLD